MYKDLISYRLAENVTEEHLKSVAQKVYDTWMKNQKGFLGWEINKQEDGTYTDIVSWESKEAAKESEKDMGNIPNAGDWFACYKEGSINSKNVISVSKYA